MLPPTGRQNQDDVSKRDVGTKATHSGQVDFCFGFDDEEGVGVGVAGGAEFLAGVVEGVG